MFEVDWQVLLDVLALVCLAKYSKAGFDWILLKIFPVFEYGPHMQFPGTSTAFYAVFQYSCQTWDTHLSWPYCRNHTPQRGMPCLIRWAKPEMKIGQKRVEFVFTNIQFHIQPFRLALRSHESELCSNKSSPFVICPQSNTYMRRQSRLATLLLSSSGSLSA